MRQPIVVLLVLALAASCATTPPPAPKKQPEVSPQLRSFIDALRERVKTDPENVTNTYTLARMLDQAGDTPGAIEQLQRLEQLGWTQGVADIDFTWSRGNPDFERMAARLNAREPRIIGSKTAFLLPQRDLIAEGIAHDPIDGAYYISSIHRRKVVRVDRDGRITDFLPDAHEGIYSTLGLKVDPAARVLWVASIAGEEMRGYTPDHQGKSRLDAFDLRTGRSVWHAEVGSKEQPSLVNDIAIIDGVAYATDTLRGVVWRAGTTLEPWLEGFFYPNGIALSDDKRHLFVADYRGITRVDLADKAKTPLVLPSKRETLSGIDGLVFHDGSLVGIQNSVGRPRVFRAVMNATRDRVERIEVLESGHPRYNMPATGALVGDDFVYMANPQLRAFDEQKRIFPEDKLEETIVLRLPLRQ